MQRRNCKLCSKLFEGLIRMEMALVRVSHREMVSYLQYVQMQQLEGGRQVNRDKITLRDPEGKEESVQKSLKSELL